MSYLKIYSLTLVFIIFFSFSLEKRNLRVENEEEEQNKETIKIQPPKFSRISGFYYNNFKLKLISEENTKIYYTVDSTDPRNSTTSQEFIDYIQIYDKSSEPNIYSAIGVNESSPVSISSFSQDYEVPYYLVDKAMIIRAVAKNSKGEFSKVITKTYFVTTEDLYKYQDLTVISIVTDPKNLFDPDIGIYVTGTKYQEMIKKEDKRKEERFNPMRMEICNYHNKGKEWEREAFITIFDKGEINLQQNVGIRIKGAFTRNNPSKSFNIFARKKYGKSTIKTNLLNDNYDINGNLITSYKSLSLRSIYDEERLRDEIGRDLFYLREGLTSPNMRNAVLFLNGEYWGFYLIQEKIDNNFISNNYLIPSDFIVLAKANEINDGLEEEFNDFNYFCGNYSLKNVSNEEIYSKVKQKIDIDSFIELYATSIYIMHLDWPGNNDGLWKYYGDTIEGNKYSDGKWRFILYDLDYTMGAEFFFSTGSPDYDMFTYIGGGRRRRRISSVYLFLNLIKNNTEFQYKFVNTICDYANGIYDNEKIDSLIKKYKKESTDLLSNSQLRWCGQHYSSIFEGLSYYKTNYYKSLDSIKNFFEQRPKFIFQHMKQYIGLKGQPVDLTIEIKGRGKVQINSIIPKNKNGIWTGKYFTRIPITIKAIPEAGYNFKEWSGYIHSIQEKEEVILFESGKITVTFE